MTENTESTENTFRYHFFCPADGDCCSLTLADEDNDTYHAICSQGHGWLVTIAEEYDSDDGTAIFGFQCDKTHVSAMRKTESTESAFRSAFVATIKLARHGETCKQCILATIITPFPDLTSFCNEFKVLTNHVHEGMRHLDDQTKAELHRLVRE